MERVLVIQTAFLGDAILGSALLERIHADHPKCRIDYLVRKGNEGLFKGHPFLNDVLVLDKQRKLPELSRLLGIIRSKDYDAVLNAQRFAFSGILTAFSRARITVGYDRNPMSFLFDRKVAHRLSHVHEIDRLTDLYRVFSPSGQSLPRLYPTTEDEYVVSSYIKRPFITVAPASVWFTKQWPEARWAGFIGLTSPSLEVIITGGPADIALCQRIAGGANRPVTIVAGKLSLLQTAALMRHALMNYANDSAPVHLASAVNAPICEMYCSTVPDFGFTPLSEVSHIMETRHGLDCRPCGIHGHRVCPKGHFKCADISPERLIAILPPH